MLFSRGPPEVLAVSMKRRISLSKDVNPTCSSNLSRHSYARTSVCSQLPSSRPPKGVLQAVDLDAQSGAVLSPHMLECCAYVFQQRRVNRPPRSCRLHGTAGLPGPAALHTRSSQGLLLHCPPPRLPQGDPPALSRWLRAALKSSLWCGRDRLEWEGYLRM